MWDLGAPDICDSCSSRKWNENKDPSIDNEAIGKQFDQENMENIEESSNMNNINE